MLRLSFRVHRLAIAGTAAASFALASCSESPSSPSREIAPDVASLSQAPELADENGRHVFHTKQWHANDNAQNDAGNAHGKPGGGGTSTGISFHGGPVLQSGTNVAAVYWASAPIFKNGPAAGTHSTNNSGDASLVGHFLRNLGGSPYFNINHSYTDGTKQIVNAVHYTQYSAENTFVPANGQNVSDADMLAMLGRAFDSGALVYEPNTLYAIFTAGTVNLGGGFGTQYCAYHWNGYAPTTKYGNLRVLYAAMPYNAAYKSACTSSLAAANGSVDPGADYEVNTLGHEIEETTTDMFGTAWFDNRGFENADKCAWTWGTTYTTGAGGKANIKLNGIDFLVQQNWVNAGSGGCALSY